MHGVGHRFAIVSQRYGVLDDDVHALYGGLGVYQQGVAVPGDGSLHVGAVGLVGDLFAIGGVGAGVVLIAQGGAGLRVFNGDGRLHMSDFARVGGRRGYGAEVAFGGVHFPVAGEVGFVGSPGDASQGRDDEGSLRECVRWRSPEWSSYSAVVTHIAGRRLGRRGLRGERESSRLRARWRPAAAPRWHT